MNYDNDADYSWKQSIPQPDAINCIAYTDERGANYLMNDNNTVWIKLPGDLVYFPSLKRIKKEG